MATPKVTTPRGLIVVTGGSGYIAGYCIAQLLNEGWRARTTVRNLGAAEEVRATIGKITANTSAIEFVAADLNSDAGWADAVAGADYVLHVASPVPTVDPKSDDELVRPARDGTQRVLKAARDAGVKRVVMTSSISAIMFGRGVREKPFTEADWTERHRGIATAGDDNALGCGTPLHRLVRFLLDGRHSQNPQTRVGSQGAQSPIYFRARFSRPRDRDLRPGCAGAAVRAGEAATSLLGKGASNVGLDDATGPGDRSRHRQEPSGAGVGVG